MGSFKYFTSIFKTDSQGAKFPALLHFVKKYKVPWILKWQYAKDGDVLTRWWFVKWLDKFSHTQRIIDHVTREYSTTIPKIQSLVSPSVQPTEITHQNKAIALTTSSFKLIKSSTKSKKIKSPLEDIRKDPNALYALLKL